MSASDKGPDGRFDDRREGEVRVDAGRTTGVVRAYHLLRLTLGRLL